MTEKTQKTALSDADDIVTTRARYESVNGDIALNFVAGGDQNELDLSNASVARVLRKIDLVLLPIMA